MTRNVALAEIDRASQGAAPALEPITVTFSEAERLTGVGPRTLYRELSAGRLLAVKRGRTTLIVMQSLRSYMAALPRATFAQPHKAS